MVKHPRDSKEKQRMNNLRQWFDNRGLKSLYFFLKDADMLDQAELIWKLKKGKYTSKYDAAFKKRMLQTS